MLYELGNKNDSLELNVVRVSGCLTQIRPCMKLKMLSTPPPPPPKKKKKIKNERFQAQK